MNKYLLGILLLILIISSNKLSYFLGCNVNKLLDNIYITEFITIIIIYYSIKIFGDKNTKSHLIHTITLYIIFKFFARMNDTFTIISLLIIAFILIENMLKNEDVLLDEKNSISDNIQLDDKEKLLVGVIVIGFIYNIYLKYNQFGTKFNIIKFFFSNKCNNKIYT
tara:strand:- start:983 stop:1480 length:498 start_codon:yes stop_codon:yes gene_type:complete